MRTTILLDDELAAQLRARAQSKGQSLSAFLAEAGRAALRAESTKAPHAFELLTYGEGGPAPGVNLDRSNELLAAEDEGTYRT